MECGRELRQNVEEKTLQAPWVDFMEMTDEEYRFLFITFNLGSRIKGREIRDYFSRYFHEKKKIFLCFAFLLRNY